MFPWLEALSMKVFGVTDFAAKFPAALSGLLTIVLAYLIAKELFIWAWAPILAMAIMGATQYFIKYAMHSMTDAPFTFFFTLSIYLYLKGLKEPGYFLLSGAAIGWPLLTRSVLGLIPLGIIFLHIIVTGKRALMLSKYFIGAVALSIALPAFWYVSQYGLYGRQFLNEHFSFVASKIGGREAVVRDDLLPEITLCRTIDGQDFTVRTPYRRGVPLKRRKGIRPDRPGICGVPKATLTALLAVASVGADRPGWAGKGFHSFSRLLRGAAGHLGGLRSDPVQLCRGESVAVHNADFSRFCDTCGRGVKSLDRFRSFRSLR